MVQHIYHNGNTLMYININCLISVCLNLIIETCQDIFFLSCIGLEQHAISFFYPVYLMVCFQIRTHVDPQTGCVIPYCPNGRFIHIPPPYPDADWANDFGRPWWRDEGYLVGILSKKTRHIKIINTLTSQDQVIEVGC